jgi:hypothetical protein
LSGEPSRDRAYQQNYEKSFSRHGHVSHPLCGFLAGIRHVRF